MQLTIDIDKNFIENLKQANTASSKLDKEIERRVYAYKNGTLGTHAFHDGLNNIRENILHTYDS